MTDVKEFGTTKPIQLLKQAEKKTHLAHIVKKISEECRDCSTPSPLKCIGGCNVWKLKNELRKLHAILTKENYEKTLLNTLKNERRLKILETITKRTLTIPQIQKELRKHSYYHSQRTIKSEYIRRLVAAGLITSNSSRYKATTFGYELNKLFSGFQKIEDFLPPHSGCYEEKIVKMLYEKPMTYAELRSEMPAESLPRVLKRLQKASLLKKNNEKHYVYYFQTRRDPQQEKLSPTEERVYRNIPEEGTTAKKLAHKTNITLRRTYKYLRRLRGKKLVFRRRSPKTYILTYEGQKIAELLEEINTLFTEFTQTTGDLVPDAS